MVSDSTSQGEMKKIILISSLLIIWNVTFSQALLTNANGLLSIDEGVSFTISGNLSNSGTIFNEGAMRLYGDWTNGGDYNSVSGTLSILRMSTIDNGSSQFSNLVIDTPEGVLATSDLSITQSLTLSNGQLILADNVSIGIKERAIINGGDQSSYINGTLYLSPSEIMNFPIGTDTEYLPVTLENVNADTLVGVRVYGEELTVALSKEIAATSPNRYWRLIGDDTFISERIQLPLANETFIEDEDLVVIGFATDSTSNLEALGNGEFVGSLISGSIATVGNIMAGYYAIASEAITGPPITVINVVTTLQDGKHDFLRIENIDFYENNLVEIYDRAGVKVFEMNGYDNADKVFRGVANVAARGELATGSYYYTIQLTGSKRESGFIYIKSK